MTNSNSRTGAAIACFIGLILLVLAPIECWAQATYEPYTFTTLAGYSGHGSADGTGSAARFSSPNGVAVDSAGTIYAADTGNHTVRKVSPLGVVTTLAGMAGRIGSADGLGNAAQFNSPGSVAVDTAGNVYVADAGNHTIRKVTPLGMVTTLAGMAGNGGNTDGPGSKARFRSPSGVAVDTAGNIYVADSNNNTIRKITPTAVVTTLAGLAQFDAIGNRIDGSADGMGSAARFSYPQSVAVDSAGNVYVGDIYNHTIRKVTPAGLVTTLAGMAGGAGSADGTGSAARFGFNAGLAVDGAGNVFVADSGNSTIRKVTPAGVVTTFAGMAGSSGTADGPGNVARFGWDGTGPGSVAIDDGGNLVVADTGNSTIRKVTAEGVVTTLAGLPGSTGSADGPGSNARFHSPSSVAVDHAGNLLVADTANNTIRKVTPEGVVTTLAGFAQLDESGSPTGGSTDGSGTAARFSNPNGVAVDSTGNVFVADTGNNTIRKITTEGTVTTMAGLAGSSGSADGMGSNARFYSPLSVAVDAADNVYVADSGNSTIRKVTPVGMVTTLAGMAGTHGSRDGVGSDARFGSDFDEGPRGVAVDSAGNVYVADQGNQTIRKVTEAGVVTTLAQVDMGPAGIAVDSGGNIYVAIAGFWDVSIATIQKVTPAGAVNTLAGVEWLEDGSTRNSTGSKDGTGIDAQFNAPRGVAVDAAGNVYVADTRNNTIRKGFPALVITSSDSKLGFTAGQFGFDLTGGPAGASVSVEVSTDLMTWIPLWTNTIGGGLKFSDPGSGGPSRRFYRARLP